MRFIIGNKNIIIRIVEMITGTVKSMLTLKKLMKDHYLNCIYSNAKGTEAQVFNEIQILK